MNVVVKNYNKKGITYSPKSESKPTTCILSLDDLEQNPYHLLRQFLEDDPEDIFKNEHIRDRPEATF